MARKSEEMAKAKATGRKKTGKGWISDREKSKAEPRRGEGEGSNDELRRPTAVHLLSEFTILQ